VKPFKKKYGRGNKGKINKRKRGKEVSSDFLINDVGPIFYKLVNRV